MIAEYEEDTHFCLKCHATILGLDNYVNHRKTECSKNLPRPPKSPLPSQLLPPDESFDLKADDFFSSLELRSSSKKPETQSTSGKNFSGILTRSKATALHASSSTSKEQTEPQQSKSGKNVWIGGHQLKELGHGDNQSKLIKAVDNLERRKEEPARLQVYDETYDDSDDYEYDDDDTSSDDHEAPPRNYTGGKWKPSSPIQWSKNTEQRDWNAAFTGGKWKASSVPPATHTKGKWKPPCQKDDYDAPPSTFTGNKWVSLKKQDDLYIPPPTFTGSKWVSPRKQDDSDIPPPTFTGSKWVSSKKQDDTDVPPPTFTGSKWVSSKKHDDPDIPPPTFTGSKWTSTKKHDYQDIPPAYHTKGKWKPRNDNEDDFPPPNHTKGKWKPKDHPDDDFPPPTHTKGKWKPKDESILDEVYPPPGHTKGKWQPKIPEEQSVTNADARIDNIEHSYSKVNWLTLDKEPTEKNVTKKTSSEPSSQQYWCNACNRKLASKVVYERHLKSELHFKRTLHQREFDDGDEIVMLKTKRQSKIAPPEPIFSTQNQPAAQKGSKRLRRKKYERCDVCQAKVNKYMLGKHLISHYHCRKGDITSSIAQSMVLDNIHGIVLESPFQCGLCKFYCNTHYDFLNHWKSSEHINNDKPGYFTCILCQHKTEDTATMFEHLVSPGHMEVVSVINRSVPIVIKKINPRICPTCCKEFQFNIQLLNHCRSSGHADEEFLKTLKNEHVCDICGLSCKSNIALKCHKRKVHKQIYYVCTPCDLKFASVEEGKAHMKSLHHKYKRKEKLLNAGEGVKMKKCEYCQETFSNFLLLKRHLIDNHPEHKIRCPYCGSNFTIAQELTVHLRTKSCKFVDDPNNTLRCDRCPFSTNSASELIFHTALHDEPLITYPEKGGDTSSTKSHHHQYRYKCPVCDKLFPKGSLHAHIRQHTKERPFVCKDCGASFARKNNLQFHEKKKKHNKKVPGGERPFLCCMCGASFKKRPLLQQHMQIHTGKLCKCPEVGCVYTARKMSEINEHLKTHSDDRNFHCNKCDYSGKTKQQLSRHMTIHDEMKKYQCTQCSFTSRNSTQLKLHARVHTGAKPFICPYCSYRCNRMENIRKHILLTNYHPGKCIYNCKFCTKYSTNSAKELKVHLVTAHADVFGDRAEAATYVSGIYDVRYDNTFISNEKSSAMEEVNESDPKLTTTADPVIALTSIQSSATSRREDQMDQMLPMLIIPKDEGCSSAVENLPVSWNLVGRYDVEEESGTLIPFQSGEESLFDEPFQ